MKHRDSNFECLRIIAMILVLIVHATFMSVVIPSTEDVNNHPIQSFCTYTFAALSIVCVNLFVLISGWFGIHFRTKRLISFIFTAFFYGLLIYVLLLLVNPFKFQNWNSLSIVLMINSTNYWFVKSYVILYIFSPILNTYIDNCNEKQLNHTLIVFFSFQTIYGWLSLYGALEFHGGYSALSFMGLYLLAQYFHRYPGFTKRWSAKHGIGLFFGIAFFNASLGFIVTRLGLPIAGRIFTYTNPLVIIQSLALLIGFSKLSFHNKLINWTASSCFAVYLIHGNDFILRTHYALTIRNWFQQESCPIFLCYTFLFISLIFIASILIDKVRIRLFQFLNLC